MKFRAFYTLPKTRISKYHLNALELAICSYIEQYDSCLAIDSTGDTREFSASDITPAQAREISAFVDGWLSAKGI